MNSSAGFLISAVWCSTLLQGSPATIVQKQEPVPGEALHSEVHLVDGSNLRGGLLLQSFPLQTPYALITIELRFVSDVSFKPDGEALVNLTNGDRLQGTLQLDTIALRSSVGRIAIPVKIVKTLHVFSPGATPTKGLVAYYPLDHGAQDLSGQKNNGFVDRVVPAVDRFGREAGALRFDGTGRLRIPDNPSLRPSHGLSVCAWIRAQEFYSGRCQANAIVFKGDDALPGWYGLLYQDDEDCGTFNPDHTRFKFGIRFDDETPGNVAASTSFSTDTFHFVVGTYDGESLRLYVDGKLEGSTKVGKSLSTRSSGDLTMGGTLIEEYPYPVTGILDDIRIYDRAITTSEISTLYGDRKGH